jgi:hypothetical protein
MDKMTYQKARIENGQIVVESTKQIDQANLTADCFMVQFQGLEACKACEYHGTSECGGGETLKQMERKG